MAKRYVVVPMTVAVLAALGAMPVGANGGDGFVTQQAAMLAGAAPGVTVRPLLTVGETLPDGYRFEAIPDGIALDKRNGHRVDVYVNHETSLVPFPYVTTPPGPTVANSLNDFDNAQVSKLTLSTRTGDVLHGSLAIRVIGELSAVLLELPGDEGAGLQPPHPVHERGGNRHRL